MRKKTHSEFVEQIHNINPTINILSEYENDKIKVLCECCQCHYQWMATPSHLVQGRGCPECGKKRSNARKTKTNDTFIAELSLINPNIDVLGKYENSKKKIEVRCKSCGHIWTPIPSSLLRGSGCPVCSGNMKKTHAEFVEQMKIINGDVEVIGQYNNCEEKIKVKCKVCGYEWFATPNSLLQGHGCRKCHFVNLGEKRTIKHEDFIKRLKEINPNVTILENYTKANDPIHAKCLKCGYEWISKPSVLLSGHGCRLCGIKKQSDSTRKSQIEFENELKDINPYIIVIGQYENNNTKLQVKCAKCGCVWENSPGNLLSGRGCPRCTRYLHTSFPEQTVYYYIHSVFNDAVSGYKELFDNNMELDIYIPSIKTGIEYDGRAWHTSKDSYIREKNKYSICKKNNVKLIRIKELRKKDDVETADVLIYRNETMESALNELFDYLGVSTDINIERDAQAISEQYKNIDANEVFVERLKTINPNIIPLSNYITASSSITCKCTICGYQWKTTPNRLLSGRGCLQCSGTMRKSTSQFTKELNEINPSIIVKGDYISASSPIEVQCKKCNYIWNPVANSLLAGNGCPRCGKRLRISHEEFVEEMKRINSNIIIIGEYKAKREPISVMCQKCGRKWETTPDNLLRGHGCAKCAGFMRKTTEEFKTEIARLNNHFEVLGEYVNARTKILVECKNCGFQRFAIPDSLLKGLKCPVCDKGKE